jgi:hypothetical protein
MKMAKNSEFRISSNHLMRDYCKGYRSVKRKPHKSIRFLYVFLYRKIIFTLLFVPYRGAYRELMQLMQNRPNYVKT